MDLIFVEDCPRKQQKFRAVWYMHAIYNESTASADASVKVSKQHNIIKLL